MKIKFINYRKEMPGYPVHGIFPMFDRFWSGKIWQLCWRGYAVKLDFRKDIVSDLMNK